MKEVEMVEKVEGVPADNADSGADCADGILSWEEMESMKARLGGILEELVEIADLLKAGGKMEAHKIVMLDGVEQMAAMWVMYAPMPEAVEEVEGVEMVERVPADGADQSAEDADETHRLKSVLRPAEASGTSAGADGQ